MEIISRYLRRCYWCVTADCSRVHSHTPESRVQSTVWNALGWRSWMERAVGSSVPASNTRNPYTVLNIETEPWEIRPCSQWHSLTPVSNSGAKRRKYGGVIPERSDSICAEAFIEAALNRGGSLWVKSQARVKMIPIFLTCGSTERERELEREMDRERLLEKQTDRDRKRKRWTERERKRKFVCHPVLDVSKALSEALQRSGHWGSERERWRKKERARCSSSAWSFINRRDVYSRIVYN